ncbi:hypothetical protein Aduo_016073 [Ancylostoma duodenale]
MRRACIFRVPTEYVTGRERLDLKVAGKIGIEREKADIAGLHGIRRPSVEQGLRRSSCGSVLGISAGNGTQMDKLMYSLANPVHREELLLSEDIPAETKKGFEISTSPT